MPLNEHLIEKASKSVFVLARESDGRLPPIRRLAEKWCVCPTTANRVLVALAKKQILTKDNLRNRYFIRDFDRDFAMSECDEPCDRVYSIVRTLTSTAMYDRAPSIRGIMGRFRCGYSTAREALERLEKDGWIARDDSGAGIFPVATHQGTTSLYVICYKRAHHHPFGSRFLGELGRTAASHGWDAIKFAYANDVRRRGLPPANESSGYILFGLRHYFPSFPATSSIPVVYVWNCSKRELPGSSSRAAGSVNILMHNKVAGIEIARHLYAQGHRRIAILSHIHSCGNEWVKERVAAIQGIFHNRPGETSSVVFSAPTNKFESPPSLNSEPGGRWRAALPQRLSEAEVDRYVPFEITKSLASNTMQFLEGLAKAGKMMLPAFRRVLRNEEITAWVCINDDLASCASHFLRTHGTSSSRNISLISFDNTPSAGMLGISSYDFLPESMARLAVQKIVHPKKHERNHQKTYELEGRLVVRESSRRRT